MGFSSSDNTGGSAAPQNPSFLDLLASKYPIASTVAKGIVGPSTQPASVEAPQLQLPDYSSSSQPDLISMNAQPKNSGKGAAILKAFFGG